MKNFAGRNWGWKLFALASATFLWMTFSGSQELSESISVPVQYRNLPRQLDISSDMVEEVHLTLRGSAPRLSRINPTVIPVVVDMSEVRHPGQRTFTLSAENIKLPVGVLLDRVVPSQIQVTLEPRISKQVAVRPTVTGLPEGMPPPTVSTDPSLLVITGPESRVNRMDLVHTDPVDYDALRTGQLTRTRAFSGDAQVRFTVPPVVTVRMILPENNN